MERVREIIRLRDLLGLSLEQLSQLLEAESARAHLRQELKHTDAPAERKRILEQLGQHIGTQLELVQGRLTELNRAGRRAHRQGAAGQAADPRDRRAVSTTVAARPAVRTNTAGAGGVNRRAMGVLSAGHLFTDIGQGSIPAMLPFLIVQGPPQLRQRVGADPGGDDLQLGDPAAVRPSLGSPLARRG